MEHPVIITSNNEISTRDRINFAARVMMPLFEIVESPTINIADVKRRRFNLIDRNI
jgi:hypothetical protein